MFEKLRSLSITLTAPDQNRKKSSLCSANQLKLNKDKTELIWTGTKYSITVGNASFLSPQLGADVILPSQHVHLLRLVISAHLGLEKHVSNVSATCFHISVGCQLPSTDSSVSSVGWVTVVGCLLSPIHRRGTRCQNTYATLLTASVFGHLLKTFLFSEY